MARITKTISISVPPAFARRIDSLKRKEGRTTSELFREALRVYEAVNEQQKKVPKYFGTDLQFDRIRFSGPRDLSKNVDKILYDR